MCRYKAEQ